MEAIRRPSSWASRGPRLRYRGAADDPSPVVPPAFCSRRNLGRRVLSPATRFVRRHRPPHLVGENTSERCEKRPRALAQTRRLNHRPPAWLAQNVSTSTASFQDARSSGSGSSRLRSNPSGSLCSGPRCGDRWHSDHRPPTAARGHGRSARGTMYLSCSSARDSSAISPAESAPPTHTSPDSSADCCNLTWRSPAVSRGTCVRKTPNLRTFAVGVVRKPVERAAFSRAETAQTRPSSTRSRSLPRQKRKRESGGVASGSLLGKTLTAIADGVAQGHWRRCWPGASRPEALEPADRALGRAGGEPSKSTRRLRGAGPQRYALLRTVLRGEIPMRGGGGHR